MRKLISDRLEIEKELEDIGFEIVGIKDINNEFLYFVRKKNKKN